MKVQLLYFEGCPHIGAARSALQEALATTGIDTRVEEIDVNAASTPASLRGWGSPTILINGVDVGDSHEALGRSCRLYRTDSGARAGAPDVDRIGAALRTAATTNGGA